MASPESSAFSMKPRAPESAISEPKSRASRLEVSTITGGESNAADAGGDLEAVDVGQLHIEEHDVRREPLDHLERAAARLPPRRPRRIPRPRAARTRWPGRSGGRRRRRLCACAHVRRAAAALTVRVTVRFAYATSGAAARSRRGTCRSGRPSMRTNSIRTTTAPMSPITPPSWRASPTSSARSAPHATM